MFCTRCGTSNPAANNFCRGCGSPLARPPLAPPTAAATRTAAAPGPAPLAVRLLAGGFATVLLGIIIGYALFADRLDLGGADGATLVGRVTAHDAANGGFLPAPVAATTLLDIPRVIELAEQTTVLVLEDGLLSSGSGSGVIVDADGYILTNKHVIEDASRFKVQLPNGDRVAATVSWVSRAHDLALLKVARSGLKTASLADSGKVRIGEEVVAAGFPLGDELGDRPTMTRGIVSRVQTTADDKTFIQTDAAVNPGNSGGPLFNLRGQVIGINTLRYDSAGGRTVIGISWAIPVNVARTVIPASARAK